MVLASFPRYVHRAIVAASCSFLVGAAAACGSDEIAGCAAIIRRDDPVLTLTVIDKNTGLAAPSIVLSNVTMDGVPIVLESAVNVTGGNATVLGNTLTCSGSCAFGSTQGTYAFRVTAGSLPVTDFSVNASYAKRTKTGCRDALSDGTKVSITL
jgi:hypothetical protein